MQQYSEFEHSERNVNTDSREQSDRAEQQNQPDVVRLQPAEGQKIYPVRRRSWLRTLGMIVLLLVLLGTLAGLGGLFVSTATVLPQHTFHVGTEPQVIVKDAGGSVTFHTGSNNTVSISAVERTSFFNHNDVQYAVEQTGNTIEVDITKSDAALLNLGSVDLDITLPAVSDIQATINAGSIDMNGISGQITVQSNAGSINFENGTLKGNSSLHANAGSITFDGSLAADGNYTFGTNAGSIDMTLPADTAFLLDASTHAGSISNAFSSNIVGSHPTSQLHVHTNAGSITISQE